MRRIARTFRSPAMSWHRLAGRRHSSHNRDGRLTYHHYPARHILNLNQGNDKETRDRCHPLVLNRRNILYDNKRRLLEHTFHHFNVIANVRNSFLRHQLIQNPPLGENSGLQDHLVILPRVAVKFRPTHLRSLHETAIRPHPHDRDFPDRHQSVSLFFQPLVLRG